MLGAVGLLGDADVAYRKQDVFRSFYACSARLVN
jgi:hypothetical protein